MTPDPGSVTSPDLTAQIACVARELRYRHKVYPRLVLQGKLTPAQAQHEMLTMAAVLRTLQRLQPHQEELPYAPSRP